jgi:O-antigen/teichoic acid export membrane protein
MLKRLLGSKLASASLLLMVSMTVVNAGNYVYNLILGRWLGPAMFADLSLIVTLLLVVTFITVPLQMTMARYAAIHTADGDAAALSQVRRFTALAALGFGLALTAIFTLGAPLWQGFFHTASAWPFAIFGLALPFSLMQGVERGVLQGQTRFGILAVTYQVEMWTRLLIGVGLVALGFSINGAVLGISLSFVATWLSARLAVKKLPGAKPLDRETRAAIIAFALPVLVSQLGQILINNSDVLLVRRFHAAETAGQYAALALIGRIVFFATWSVVTTMFPIVAQRQKKGEPHRHLLWLSLGIVAGISTPIILAALFFPEFIVTTLFGSQYLGVAHLLWLYALATSLYALANVVINYRLSLGMGRETRFAVAAGVAQVLGILLFHETLAQVVWVQVVVMATLFVLLLAYNFLSHKREAAGNVAETV